jgi:hypothetical protein
MSSTWRSAPSGRMIALLERVLLVLMFAEIL